MAFSKLFIVNQTYYMSRSTSMKMVTSILPDLMATICIAAMAQDLGGETGDPFGENDHN